MAPIYDIRDPEPLSDDDSFEVLDVLSNLFNENTDSPSDGRASGSSDHALPACLDLNASSKGDGDKASEAEMNETTGHSEPPPVDDSTKVMDARNSPFSDELLEEREASAAEPEQEQKINVNSTERGDGDKLTKLEGDVNFGIDPELFHNPITRSVTVSADSNQQSCTLHHVSKDKLAEVNRSGDSGEERTQSYQSMGGVRKDSNSSAVPSEVIPARGHQTKDKAQKVNLESIGKFSSQNGREYIKIKGPSSVKMPQFGYSARLTYGQLNFAIHNQGSLMVTDDNFLARVSLDQPQLLNGTRNFSNAEEVLFNQLRIDQVFFDEVTADRDKHREQFLMKMEHVIKELSKEDVITRIELLKLVERSEQRSSLTYVDLCRKIQSDRFQCLALHEEAEALERVEQKAARRERMFLRFRYHPKDNSPNLLLRLDELLKQIVAQHKNTLLTGAPAYLHKPLDDISVKHLILINRSDVKLFTDMNSALKADIFEKPIEHLANRWINRVRSIKVDWLDKPPQLTSISLFFLCKSLEELIIEITEHTDHRATDLLASSALGWFPIKKIVWKTESAFTTCLQREYDFIFRLLNHFEVASDFGRQPFQYKMQLFDNGRSTSRRVLRGIKNAFVRTGQLFGYGRQKPNPFGVSDDFYVWYCLLDDILFHVLPNDCELDMFDNVFQGYVQMIRDAKYDQMETLRVVTHNLARYIAQSCSYGGRTPLNASLDKAVLRKQLDIFSFKTNQSVVSSNNFRDQIDVFNGFWKTC